MRSPPATSTHPIPEGDRGISAQRHNTTEGNLIFQGMSSPSNHFQGFAHIIRPPSDSLTIHATEYRLVSPKAVPPFSIHPTSRQPSPRPVRRPPGVASARVELAQFEVRPFAIPIRWVSTVYAALNKCIDAQISADLPRHSATKNSPTPSLLPFGHTFDPPHVVRYLLAVSRRVSM